MKRTNPDTVATALSLLHQGNFIQNVAKRLCVARLTIADIRKMDKENIPLNQGGRPSC
jgi:hypothetical protein